MRVEDLKAAQENIILILCKIELIFSPVFFDIMMHLVLHLSDEAINGRPVQNSWIFPIESTLGLLRSMFVTGQDQKDLSPKGMSLMKH